MKKESIGLTPAQQKLLQLLESKEANEHYEALKTVHYLATYHVDEDLVDLSASRYVHNLLEVVWEMEVEGDVL